MFKLIKEFLVTGIEANKISTEASVASISASGGHLEVNEQMRDYISAQKERAGIDLDTARKQKILHSVECFRAKSALSSELRQLKELSYQSDEIKERIEECERLLLELGVKKPGGEKPFEAFFKKKESDEKRTAKK